MANADRCVCCGEIIPEGTMACPNCLVVSKKQDKRLIDANALKEKLQEHHDFFVDGCGGFRYLTPKDKARVDEITHCIAEITNAHTVDAVEVVHGEWEMGLDEGDYEYGTCSVCGYNEYNAFGCLLPHNYCPNCGAKMDGERKDNGSNI